MLTATALSISLRVSLSRVLAQATPGCRRTSANSWRNEHTPGDYEKRTVLFSTGAEAIENAVKVARSATGRERVLVFDDAYHGRSLLTMAMTAKENPWNIPRRVNGTFTVSTS